MLKLLECDRKKKKMNRNNFALVQRTWFNNTEALNRSANHPGGLIIDALSERYPIYEQKLGDESQQKFLSARFIY
jgi:hypothetical protein